MEASSYLMSSEYGPADIEKMSEKQSENVNNASIRGGNFASKYNFISKDTNLQNFLKFDLNEFAGGFFTESLKGGADDKDDQGLDLPDMENEEYVGGFVQDEELNDEFNKIDDKIKKLHDMTHQELYGGAKKSQAVMLGYVQKVVKKLRELTDNKFGQPEYVKMAWSIIRDARSHFGEDKTKRNDVKLIEPLVEKAFSDGSYKKHIKK